MPLSTAEFANARETVTRILEELRLDAYLFEVEPSEEELEIKIECAVKEGWETVKLPVAKGLLLRSFDDPDAHRKLVDEWRNALSDCRKSGSTPLE